MDLFGAIQQARMGGGFYAGRRIQDGDWPKPPPPPPEAPPMRYFTGLDLGQQADYSALVVVERNSIPDPAREGRFLFTFDVRHLHRWPLKTPYPQVVEDVKKLFAEGPLQKSTLVIDETGVGRAVVDMFRQAKVDATLRPYTITCGNAVTGRTVAKKHLVGAVQAPLSSGRLRFAAELELTPVLQRELQTFEVTRDEQTRNESFAAFRNNAHDDLVLGTALAVFVANVGEVFVFIANV